MGTPIWSRMSEDQQESLKKNWHKFSTNPLSIIGLSSVVLVIFLAVFAPWIAPS
ncbi:MAG: hypothetical protein HWN71_03270, partial [Desulfobacterales bacterium]|nr:hypothetical protein [Desulfobacterales bacterium]